MECDLWSQGKVSKSDELVGSDCMKVSIDHSGCMDPCNQDGVFLNIPICLHNMMSQQLMPPK